MGNHILLFVAPYQLQTYEVIGDKLGSSGYLVYLNKDTFRHLNLGDDYPFFKRDQETYSFFLQISMTSCFN